VKEQWKTAYRFARIVMNSKPSKVSELCRFSGVQFRAFAVLWYHRDEVDRLSVPAYVRLEQSRLVQPIIDEILKERL